VNLASASTAWGGEVALEPVVQRPRARLPAGEYFVGDPCYLLSDGMYESWVAAAQADLSDEDLYVADVAGHRVAACGIVWDCDFTDAEGREYGEDSGLIGAVPVVIAVQDDPDIVGMVHRITFPADFDVYVSERAVNIGHITLNTFPDE
jgi:hypothetical protein